MAAAGGAGGGPNMINTPIGQMNIRDLVINGTDPRIGKVIYKFGKDCYFVSRDSSGLNWRGIACSIHETVYPTGGVKNVKDVSSQLETSKASGTPHPVRNVTRSEMGLNFDTASVILRSLTTTLYFRAIDELKILLGNPAINETNLDGGISAAGTIPNLNDDQRTFIHNFIAGQLSSLKNYAVSLFNLFGIDLDRPISSFNQHKFIVTIFGKDNSNMRSIYYRKLLSNILNVSEMEDFTITFINSIWATASIRISEFTGMIGIMLSNNNQNQSKVESYSGINISPKSKILTDTLNIHLSFPIERIKPVQIPTGTAYMFGGYHVTDYFAVAPTPTKDAYYEDYFDSGLQMRSWRHTASPPKVALLSRGQKNASMINLINVEELFNLQSPDLTVPGNRIFSTNYVDLSSLSPATGGGAGGSAAHVLTGASNTLGKVHGKIPYNNPTYDRISFINQRDKDIKSGKPRGMFGEDTLHFLGYYTQPEEYVEEMKNEGNRSPTTTTTTSDIKSIHFTIEELLKQDLLLFDKLDSIKRRNTPEDPDKWVGLSAIDMYNILNSELERLIRANILPDNEITTEFFNKRRSEIKKAFINGIINIIITQINPDMPSADRRRFIVDEINKTAKLLTLPEKELINNEINEKYLYNIIYNIVTSVKNGNTAEQITLFINNTISEKTYLDEKDINYIKTKIKTQVRSYTGGYKKKRKTRSNHVKRRRTIRRRYRR